MLIRAEQPKDKDAVYHVNEAAFCRPDEAQLVDRLRDGGQVTLSLVAVVEEQIVGHVLFGPIALQDGEVTHSAVSLAPLAVLPAFQKQGIGSALVRQGLDELRAAGHSAVVVLGHHDYYPKFGFETASKHGITCPYDAPDEAFMVAILSPEGLDGLKGRVVYPPQFEG